MPESPANEAPRSATLRPSCRELPARRRRAPKSVGAAPITTDPETVVIEPPRRRRIPKPIIVYPKIRYRRSDRGERMLTVTDLFHGCAVVPMIRMRGWWLRKLGFTIGARIVVSEEHGRIVLTLAGAE